VKTGGMKMNRTGLRWGAAVVLASFFGFFNAAQAAGKPPIHRPEADGWSVGVMPGHALPVMLAQRHRGRMKENLQDYRSLSPEEKAWLQKKYHEWQSLPPERQRMLRRKMNRWKQLPPEDRELFRQRYQQWRSLPPQEREALKNKLRKWDQLSPQERESIQQRFRRH
jgi:hypothetical protein